MVETGRLWAAKMERRPSRRTKKRKKRARLRDSNPRPKTSALNWRLRPPVGTWFRASGQNCTQGSCDSYFFVRTRVLPSGKLSKLFICKPLILVI